MKKLLILLLLLLSGCVSADCLQVKKMFVVDHRCPSGYYLPYASGPGSCVDQKDLVEIKKMCPNF
jgi:hypothetical protein